MRKIGTMKPFKFAIVLFIVFVAVKSYQELQARLLLRAIASSALIGGPFLMFPKIYELLENLSKTTQSAVLFITFPLALLLFNWLHTISVFYETTFIMACCFILLFYRYPANKKKVDEEC